MGSVNRIKWSIRVLLRAWMAFSDKKQSESCLFRHRLVIFSFRFMRGVYIIYGRGERETKENLHFIKERENLLFYENEMNSILGVSTSTIKIS